MRLGFTGTQHIPRGERSYVAACLQDLVDRLSPTVVVTGGCIGIDAFVHHWMCENHPIIKRVVCLPHDRSKVDEKVILTADELHEDRATYRARNEQIVELSDVMAAFWTGQRAYSGTYMTMNIAMRSEKISRENVYGMKLLPSSEARERYFDART